MLLLQSHLANCTKHSTKYSLVKGIQSCANEGPHHLQRGDKNKNQWWYLNIIVFSSSIGPISTKLLTKHPWFKETQRSHAFFQGEIIEKNEYTLTTFENFLHNHWANFNQTWQSILGWWFKVFTNIKDHYMFKMELMIFFFFTWWYNHGFVQGCLLIGTISYMSNVAHGPIVI